jgi:cell wall-associated NlpC family hydrolase
VTHWAAHYIGKPWRPDADGPQAYDCKGLVRAVQRARWGREVPALQVADTRTDEGRAAFMAAVRRGGWQRTHSQAIEGDVLLVQGSRGAHVGTFVTVGRTLGVLHAPGMHDAQGRPQGRVVWQELRDLLASGYTRPEVWRCS